MKKDKVEFFKDFHKNSSFVKSRDSTFLVLISKKNDAKSISDFYLISLVACVYKLISKVLAKRLSKVLNQIIGGCQHTFVFGRQILDAILISNEIVDDIHRNKGSGVLCKLDM